MSSPVVFSLTAAQCRALRCLAEGKASDAPERPLRQLVIKGLVSDCSGWSLTPAGEAAALMVGRLTEASPVSGGLGGSADSNSSTKASHDPRLGIHAVSAAAGETSAEGAGRSPLGINARSSDATGNKSQEIKGHTHPRHPRLSRLAQSLLHRGGCLPGSREEPVCELAPAEWALVLAHEARAEVLEAAQLRGARGVRSLLADLRARPPAE